MPRSRIREANRTSLSTGAWRAFAVLLLGFFAVLCGDPQLHLRLTSALLVTLSFAIFAWASQGVTYDGAIAGFLATVLMFLAAGPAMFGTVLLVFLLTFSATKYRARRKQALAISEGPGGRDGVQVLANLGLAALAAGLSTLTPDRAPFLVGSLAALAEAACDTVSSETGKALAGEARLIISGRIVPAGTNGAVSLPGTLLGVFAAAVVALEAVVTGLVELPFGLVVVASGILGMLLDSLLGATLERRGWLTNNGVNLLSTGFSAMFATLSAWQLA